MPPTKLTKGSNWCLRVVFHHVVDELLSGKSGMSSNFTTSRLRLKLNKNVLSYSGRLPANVNNSNICSADSGLFKNRNFSLISSLYCKIHRRNLSTLLSNFISEECKCANHELQHISNFSSTSR